MPREEFGEQEGRDTPRAAQGGLEGYVSLLLAFKRLTEAHGKGLPYRLPPEARWERIQEGPSLEVFARLIEALHALGKANPSLQPLAQGAVEALHEGLKEALAPGLSRGEAEAVLTRLLEAVEGGEAELPPPRIPPPAAKLMTGLLFVWDGVRVLHLEAGGDGELLAQVYRRMLEFYGADPKEPLPSGLPRLPRWAKPPQLYAAEEDGLRAFATWAHLASLGLEAAVSTRPAFIPGGYEGILAHLVGVGWERVKEALDLLSPEGRMVLLLEEEAAGGPDPTGLRRWLVEKGYILGAVRLDPILYGTGGVVLVLSLWEGTKRGILMADTAKAKPPLDGLDEEVIWAMKVREPHGSFVARVPWKEMAAREFSLNPGHYL